MNSLSDRTQQFLYNLNNNYIVEVYSDGTDTFNPGDIIAPYSVNRVYFAYNFTGILPAVLSIGFTSPEGVIIPFNLLDSRQSFNINFDSVMPMQEYRAYAIINPGFFAYGIVRQPIGGD